MATPSPREQLQPKRLPCPTCGSRNTIDGGDACAHCGCDLPNVSDQIPAAQDSANTTDAPAGCLHPFCSPPFAVGLRPTPITESFEQWWGEHGGKCEALIANIGVKAAVERGFFAGYVSSDSTLNKLDSAASERRKHPFNSLTYGNTLSTQF